ncbi:MULTISPECIES: flagellar hook-associated protein FlgL [Brevibacillus]|uniref:flagellar hook-associated protein FlgL n=1 Tax=Brevibacillus TaxID=55080 RepID=UPI000D1087D8|nr:MULTISPECIES: flagellar hook-associated protein FlgL [Brevibacillus]PSJ67303.1 flagellar hook-associated protein FlgL [Brevibacillus brevis]RED21646.1 flagellar hook-associated protein 3 FlgL [Brevibacillus brevis]TQK63078.1 flagellar hook-associated protein 3 FlgL [Brevibacillus sp. AG162]VEF86682.1 Hook-filament junction protein [Brevibacillus brevis]GEC91895.1 flagellar hook-associated protein FlgL [Brevibacillus brevis]
MAIRVTQNMLNNNMMRNLNNSMGIMDKYQEQLSSGRKIAKPSDDPVVAARGMLYRSSLMENNQYQRNATEAQSWLELSDDSMDQATDVLQRVRELLVQSGDASLADDSLIAMGEEIKQLKNQLGSIANATVGGRYIFAGTDTLTAPYQGGDFVNQNTSEIRLEVSKQVYVPINVNGQTIFNKKDADGDNVFKLLDAVVSNLSTGAPANDMLEKMDFQMDNLMAERAALGARVNRIELVHARLATEEVNVSGLMSTNEDADVAEVITNLKTQENVHRAALGAGSRIIQPTLLDFLR